MLSEESKPRTSHDDDAEHRRIATVLDAIEAADRAFLKTYGTEAEPLAARNLRRAWTHWWWVSRQTERLHRARTGAPPSARVEFMLAGGYASHD